MGQEESPVAVRLIGSDEWPATQGAVDKFNVPLVEEPNGPLRGCVESSSVPAE